MSVSGNFTVACPKCNKRYVVSPAAIGKKATCKCGRSFTIEVPEDDLDEEDDGDYGVADDK